METVKVDIRRLQNLNDRINQTIDALAQLRQSVHGFQNVGLQHSTAVGYPFAQQPIAYAQAAQQMPFYGQQTVAAPWAATGGLSHTSLPLGNVATGADPANAIRIAQAFPYAFSPMPVVVPV